MSRAEYITISILLRMENGMNSIPDSKSYIIKPMDSYAETINGQRMGRVTWESMHMRSISKASMYP